MSQSPPPAPSLSSVVVGDQLCRGCNYNLRGVPLTANCPECGRPVASSVREAPPTPAAVTIGGVVGEDRPCVACGYNLRGLPVTGNCPECGKGVEYSLRGILLRYAEPAYLKEVTSGLSFILNAILASIVVGVLGFAAAAAGGTGGIMSLLALAGFGVTIVSLLGYWRYTTPDPGFTGVEKPDSARSWARVAVVAMAALSLANLGLTLGIEFAPATISDLLDLLSGLVVLGIYIVWAVQFFSVMRYTRWVASRIPDEKIVARTGTYMWLLPVLTIVGAILLMLGPLIALILYWNLLDKVRKQVRWALSASAAAAASPAGV